MSDEDLSELEELVGEWADAASKDAVEEDLLALDTLADEWAHKAGALDLDAGSDQDAALVVSAEMDTSAPPDEIILDEELDELEDDLSVDEDWAGRAAVTVPEPPAPDEPITLPKRPDPVTLPPLPSGNLSDAAKQGDRRYASPIEPPLPGPKSNGVGASDTPPAPGRAAASEPETAPDKDETPAAAVAAGTLAAGAAAVAGAAAMASRTGGASAKEPDTPKPAQPVAMPVAPPPPEKPRLRPVEPASEPAGPRTVHAREDDDPVWRRWLPFGLVAGAGVTWLAIMAATGQNTLDETSPPRVIEQAARTAVRKPVQTASTNTSAAKPERAVPAKPAAADPKTVPPTRKAETTAPAAEASPSAADTKPPAATAKPPAASTQAASEPVAETPKTKAQTAAKDVQSADPTPAVKAAPKPVPTEQKPIVTAEAPSAQDSAATEAPAAAKPVAAKKTPEPTPAGTKPATPDTKVAAKVPAPKPAAPKAKSVAAVPAPTAETPKPAPKATVPISKPVAPRGKPKILTAAPKSRPGLKPASINRSVELSRARTARAPAAPATTRTVTRTTTSPRQVTTYRAARLQPVTAIDLLHDDAAKGARQVSTPNATATFNASINRALLLGVDGEANALRTPDGRLLALKILDTRVEQLRSVMIPRAREVQPPPSNLVLEESWTRTASRVGLRARPAEGPAIETLERGRLLKVIGRVKGTDWRLVGANGRAIGYLLSSELMFATERAGVNLSIEDANAISYDVARVRTRCRTAHYAIEKGGASGGFTACRVYGGEWVLERSGDLTALSPGRLVFKR